MTKISDDLYAPIAKTTYHFRCHDCNDIITFTSELRHGLCPRCHNQGHLVGTETRYGDKKIYSPVDDYC